MADGPPQATPLRPRAPDTAADLGLYGAPLVFGAPVIVAAPGAAALAAAPSPSDHEFARAGPDGTHRPPADFGLWTPDADIGAGVAGSIGAVVSTAPASNEAKAGFGEDADIGKVVVVHAGASAPPAPQQASALDPVARADAAQSPADPPSTAAAGAAAAADSNLVDPSGQAALNAIAALTDTASGQLAAVAGTAVAIANDGLGLAGETLNAASGLVAGTIDGLGGLLAELGRVGGTDPLGGIATLVDMIGTADLLDLTGIAAPAGGLQSAIGTATDPLVEAASPAADLVEAVPADVLLGVADTDSGPLGLLGQLTDDVI